MTCFRFHPVRARSCRRGNYLLAQPRPGAHRMHGLDARPPPSRHTPRVVVPARRRAPLRALRNRLTGEASGGWRPRHRPALRDRFLVFLVRVVLFGSPPNRRAVTSSLGRRRNRSSCHAAARAVGPRVRKPPAHVRRTIQRPDPPRSIPPQELDTLVRQYREWPVQRHHRTYNTRGTIGTQDGDVPKREGKKSSARGPKPTCHYLRPNCARNCRVLTAFPGVTFFVSALRTSSARSELRRAAADRPA